jgi:hypothetical protein
MYFEQTRGVHLYNRTARGNLSVLKHEENTSWKKYHEETTSSLKTARGNLKSKHEENTSWKKNSKRKLD